MTNPDPAEEGVGPDATNSPKDSAKPGEPIRTGGSAKPDDTGSFRGSESSRSKESAQDSAKPDDTGSFRGSERQMSKGSAQDSAKPGEPNRTGGSAKPVNPDSAGKRAKKKKRRKSELTRFLIKIGVLGAVAAVTFIWVMGIHIHHGNSMYPFVMDGDLLIVFKPGITYHVGDVVLYRSPDTDEKRISRIAAIGTNEIHISEAGELLINGYIPSENVFYRTEQVLGSVVKFPYSMGEDEYFLLDDFRMSGKDSRIFGAVTKDNLLGKVSYVLRRRGI